MQSLSKTTALDMLEFVSMRTNLAMTCMEGVSGAQELLLSNEGMNLFDATCMRLQTIGETMKKLDTFTGGNLLKCYKEIFWRDIFGLRNIISHDYLAIDPELIFDVVSIELPVLSLSLQSIISDVKAGKHDSLFR